MKSSGSIQCSLYTDISISYLAPKCLRLCFLGTAKGGLQRMMKEGFPKRKLNLNSMYMSPKIRQISHLQKLWESEKWRQHSDSNSVTS